MQAASWINLFQRIPGNLHDSIALILTTGSELVVQRFVRLDPEFLVLRGRLAGTQDNGRVVALPYHQILAFAFTKKVSDAEVDAIFGTDVPAFAAAVQPASAADEEGVLEDTTVDGEEPEVNAPSRPALPSKSMLLAKLRARLNDNGKAGK